jgi:outer membrane protein insertion porin family
LRQRQQATFKWRWTRGLINGLLGQGACFGLPQACLSLVLLLTSWLIPIPALADEELDFGLETNRLARIELNGNTTFTDNDLKSVLRIQEPSWTRPLVTATYRPRLVETQVNLIKNYYRNRGFHQVSADLDSVSSVPEKGDVLHITIIEGPRTIIGHVGFSDTTAVPEASLRGVMYLLEGRPAPADLNGFGADIYAIRDVLRNATYLQAKVVPSMVIRPDTVGSGFLADVLYRIDAGPPFTIGKINLVGNAHTQDNLLTRELEFHSGDPLYWRKVEQSRRQLLVTSLFRDVTITPVAVDSVPGLADLKVQVVERRPAYYEFGVGVGSLERIRLLAAWGHNNLWGTGRRVQLRTRAAWNLEDVVGTPASFDEGQINYWVDADYVNPRLRSTRYSFDLNAFFKRETRGESGLNLATHGLNVGTTWKPSRRVTNNAYLGLKITDPSVHPYAPEDLKIRFAETGVALTQTRSVNWAIFIDHRDDLYRPSAGMYTYGTAKLAGGVMGGDYSFIRWTAAWHNYHTTPVGGVLALRVMFGGARPFGRSLELGADGVPYDDRFFAGGASTVRGYGHNSLGPQVQDQDELDYLNYTSENLLPENPARGGNYLMLTNVEYRFPLPVLRRWKLSSVFFFEGGNVWAEARDISMRAFRLSADPGDPLDPGSTKAWDYRYSYGTGVRLDTPIGPVRVDVGFPLKRAKYVSETVTYTDPEYIWHFSLGYPF